MSALPTRADYVAGLRHLADLLATTDGPLPKYSIGVSGALGDALEVETAAKALGVPFVVQDYDDGVRHFRAFGRFGPVEIRLSHVEDIPVAGEEVAGPGAGSATAPTESAAGVTDPPADGEPHLSGTPAAVPAPAPRGDGAAVTPDVWVPTRRRGINYHTEAVDRRFTTCGRASRAKYWMPLTEAVAFGAVPCPRCYGGVS